jgi:hypothetical protein
MQVERYRIVLTGWTMSGHQTQEVVAELSRLFKLPESRIRPLLVGEPSIIRRDLTLEKAEHLRNKIEKRGAVCSLKRVVREKSNMRPESDSFDQTGMLEPDLNMESTQFVMTAKPLKPVKLKPGFFSRQSNQSGQSGLSRSQLLLLFGGMSIAAVLVFILLQ